MGSASEGGLQSPVTRSSRFIAASETFGLRDTVDQKLSGEDVRGGRRSGTVVGFLLTLAVAHTAQALPHFPCWLWEPRAEYSAETGSTLRRFIASAFSNRAGEYGA